MKLNKKLLIFALSIVMIVGIFALAAFAAESAAANKDDIAFTYLDTATGTLYEVSYEADCGGTPEGVGEKFHELFAFTENAYEITMYKDMRLSKAIPFGKYTTDGDSSHNRDYFNTAVSGDIVWDLNGTTVTINSSVTGLVRMAAANCSVAAGADGKGATYGGNTFFGFEGYKTNSVILKSSVPGGKMVNESSAVLFGVGEGKRTRIVFEGENLTIVSSKTPIIASGELNRDCADLKNGNDARHVINGGVYVGGGSTVFTISMSASIKNATIISTSASASQLISQDGYRIGNVSVENCTFVASNAAALAYKAGSSNAHKFTFKDCVYVNCVPTNMTACPKLASLAYEGTNVASTEENLALIHDSAPDGTAKYTFTVIVAQADGTEAEMELVGYAAADKVLAVTYAGIGTTENYLVGKEYRPLDLVVEDYVLSFDLDAGILYDLPYAWANIPAAGIVSEGGVVTATVADNPVPLAFALTAGEDVVGYVLANSDTVGAELASALAAQENAATLYVYQDITAPALSIVQDVTVDLTGKMLTLGGMLTVADGATLSVSGGEILSAKVTPFNVEGSLSLSDGVKVYLSSATLVCDGSGTVSISDSCIYNLASASLTMNATATVTDAKLMGVSLGSRVFVNGTVLGTEGTFQGNTYVDGVVSGLIVNNNTETVTVLGQTYTVTYAEAATNVASKAITVTYSHKNIVRGEQKYYIGSVASFHKEFAPGYYFTYSGESPLEASATVECEFHADTSKLKAQIILTDALNFTYYLQVEDAGVLTNLKLNGTAIDFADLEQVEIEGSLFYVIPVSFVIFADALNDYVLSVDLVSGEDVLNISASVALDEYLATILATAEEEEAKKAYAVGSYISTLINYFDYEFFFGDVRMKNLGRLNNLLADYEEYKVEAELPEDTDVSSAYITSVVLVADEKVTFAFRVENDFEGKIMIGDSELALSKPFDGFDRTYATMAVSLSDLSETITLTVTDAEGNELETMTYSLADYLAGVAAQNEGTAGAYAAALWNLANVLG